MEHYANLSRRLRHHILRHEIRDPLSKVMSQFRNEKLPHLHGYIGFPDESIVDYLVRAQGMPETEMASAEKHRYSEEILISLDACSEDNPIRTLLNPEPLIRAIHLLEEFERDHQDYLHSFFGYDNGDAGLSLDDLDQQLKDHQFTFCHRIADRLDRAFWTLPADLLVAFDRQPESSETISGWKVTGWLIQREKVIAQAEAVLTTAYFDGLSKKDFIGAFEGLGEYMGTLGQAIAHEIGRSALPFDCFDSLYGDEDDNVTGCLHLQQVETLKEFQQQGYARSLILGLGESIRHLNEMDVITQAENGWRFTDPATFNCLIKTCHNSLIHHIAANHVALTSISDPVSVMIERHIGDKKACHGAAIAEVVEEASVIKDQLISACKRANRQGMGPLGECWIFYPQWEPETDFTTPAGELA